MWVLGKQNQWSPCTIGTPQRASLQFKTIEFVAVQKTMSFFSFLFVVVLAISNAAAADPAAELANFSVFNNINVAELAKGEPKVAHGPALSGSVISAQSCFVVGGAPARVNEAL